MRRGWDWRGAVLAKEASIPENGGNRVGLRGIEGLKRQEAPKRAQRQDAGQGKGTH